MISSDARRHAIASITSDRRIATAPEELHRLEKRVTPPSPVSPRRAVASFVADRIAASNENEACRGGRRGRPRTALPFVRCGRAAGGVDGGLSAAAGCAQHTIRRLAAITSWWSTPALATARKQVYDLSLSPPPTFDDAGSLEIGELQVTLVTRLRTCNRACTGLGSGLAGWRALPSARSCVAAGGARCCCRRQARALRGGILGRPRSRSSGHRS